MLPASSRMALGMAVLSRMDTFFINSMLSTTFEDTTKLFGADDARHIADFPAHLRSLSPLYSSIYLDLPPSSRRSTSRSKTLLKFLNAASNKSDAEAVMESVSSFKRRPLAPEIARLRAIKSEAEVEVMRQAAVISGRAHARVCHLHSAFRCMFLTKSLKTMRFTEPGMSETHLAAHFEYLCAREGSQRLAYVPVVASGYVRLLSNIAEWTENIGMET